MKEEEEKIEPSYLKNKRYKNWVTNEWVTITEEYISFVEYEKDNKVTDDKGRIIPKHTRPKYAFFSTHSPQMNIHITGLWVDGSRELIYRNIFLRVDQVERYRSRIEKKLKKNVLLLYKTITI